MDFSSAFKPKAKKSKKKKKIIDEKLDEIDSLDDVNKDLEDQLFDDNLIEEDLKLIPRDLNISNSQMGLRKVLD